MEIAKTKNRFRAIAVMMIAAMALCLSGCNKDAVTGEDIIEHASQYVGCPYEWGGTSLTDGCDSAGFIAGVLAEVGLVPDESADAHAYDTEALSQIGTAVSEDDVQIGDILIYGAMSAFYIDDTHIIYAKSIKDRIVIEEVESVSSAFGGVTAIRRVV